MPVNSSVIWTGCVCDMDRLTPNVIIALFVRLFAIGLLIYLVRILLAEFSAFIYLDPYSFNYLVVVAVAFIGFLSAFLWKFPLFVASKLAKFEEVDSSEERLTEKGVYTLGFVLLGTYLLYLSVSDTAYWWSSISAHMEITQNTYELGIHEKATILSIVLEFVMSLFLIIGAARISRFVYWLRHVKT